MLYNYLESCISITKVKNNRKPIQTGYGSDTSPKTLFQINQIEDNFL